MSRPRRSKIARLCEFVRLDDSGVAVYRCLGCRRDMQPDNRKGGVRKLAGVVRHDRGGYCGSCTASIRRTGKPCPIGGPSRHRQPSTPIEPPQRSGICECGCGQPTALATETDRRRGNVRGYPVRFVHGHSGAVGGRPAVVPEAEVVWKARAACRRAGDPRAFEMPEGWRGPGAPPAAVLAARRFCAHCPVLAECSELAVAIEGAGSASPVVGLWGGEWRSFAGVDPIHTAGPIPTPAPAPRVRERAGSAA